jgi:hypothetical protein
LSLQFGYCAFAGVVKGCCPSYVRFPRFGDRGNNANTCRAHGPNVSCLVESALLRSLPVLKFAIKTGRSDPERAKTWMNDLVRFLSPETERNLQLLCADWHNPVFSFS